MLTSENRNYDTFSKTTSLMDKGKISDLLNDTLNKSDAFSKRIN